MQRPTTLRSDVPAFAPHAEEEPTDPGTRHAQVCEIGKVYAVEWKTEELNSFGGQGEVYTVSNVRTGKRYAMKVLRGAIRQDPICKQRFLKEGEVLNEFANVHLGVVQVYQVGDDSEIGPYIVMELLNGTTLEHVARHGVAPLTGLTALLEIASVLDLVHEHGIIHRDIKPSNIFLHQPETGPRILKLIDFGAMKGNGKFHIPTTREGRFIGTPSFMSPEQMRGERATPAMDVYSLGMTAYWMFSGQSPFALATLGEATADELMMWAVGGARVPLTERVRDFPKALSDLVDRMIRPRAEERLPTMAAVLDVGRKLYTALANADRDRARHEAEEDERMNARIREEIARAAKDSGMPTAYNLHHRPVDEVEVPAADEETAILSAQRDKLASLLAQHQAEVASGHVAPGALDLGAIGRFIADLDAALASRKAVGPLRPARTEELPTPSPGLATRVATPTPPVAREVPATSVEPRFASLIGLEGAFRGVAWEIAFDTVRVGRDPKSHVALDDGSVSGLHARLEPRTGPGGRRLELIDAESSNGTMVNGERVARVALADRDRITFGRVKFEYRLLGGRSVATVLREGTPRTEKIGEELPENWSELTQAYRDYLDGPPKRRPDLRAAKLGAEGVQMEAAPTAGSGRASVRSPRLPSQSGRGGTEADRSTRILVVVAVVLFLVLVASVIYLVMVKR